MIENKFVKIKNGKKEYIKKNKILDAYLKKIVDRQVGTLNIEDTGIYQTDNQFSLDNILFKLDTPIEDLDSIGKNELQLLSENENVDGLKITNNGDNSISLEGTAKKIEGNTVQGTSFTITDTNSNQQAEITEIKAPNNSITVEGTNLTITDADSTKKAEITELKGTGKNSSLYLVPIDRMGYFSTQHCTIEYVTDSTLGKTVLHITSDTNSYPTVRYEMNRLEKGKYYALRFNYKLTVQNDPR